ncbi:MAG: hypothetical protein IJL80_07175 [Treponema sp.]|nr:hypothetical protein [Treponema sp.]
MKSCKSFVIAFVALVLLLLASAGAVVVIVDPYFHYHKPLEGLFYELNNERSQNDGITKHFDYDAIITGTSMTENFKTSEADRIFDARFIKVPYSGASFKEINDNLKVAFTYNKKLRMVIRSLEPNFIASDKNWMRIDQGNYPTYLYDKNILNDVSYVFNREAFSVCAFIVYNSIRTGISGCTDFDRYSNWMKVFTFGKEAVFSYKGEERECFSEPEKQVPLSQKDLQNTIENITQNVTALAQENPQCTFFYFFAPYSIVFWGRLYETGTLEQQLEIERTTIELILSCGNIRLYSFNTEFDLVTNLDNYKDLSHYGEWINSLMLEYMKEGRGLLTKDNYLDYLAKEKEFYLNFDYNSLFVE